MATRSDVTPASASGAAGGQGIYRVADPSTDINRSDDFPWPGSLVRRRHRADHASESTAESCPEGAPKPAMGTAASAPSTTTESPHPANDAGTEATSAPVIPPRSQRA